MYSEPHPCAKEIYDVAQHDITSHPDLVLIMGTSLTIPGICQLVRDFSRELNSQGCVQNTILFHFVKLMIYIVDQLPRPLVIFVNLTRPPGNMKQFIDYWVAGETDTWTKICEKNLRSSHPEDRENLPTACGASSTLLDIPEIHMASTSTVENISMLLGIHLLQHSNISQLAYWLILVYNC